MRLLAIEAATFCGSIALMEDGEMRALWNQDSLSSYSELLLPAVKEILAKVGWTPADLDGIAVSRGPGSFTALRIGMSVAKTLAYGTGKPLVGVSTLEALALRSPSP
ncbi:MAG: tRNA (adenosine(37)-N6)-threonylcarbamoyltransferase complex dimerization subunit type 1 TsaB, partial [bacterium]